MTRLVRIAGVVVSMLVGPIVIVMLHLPGGPLHHERPSLCAQRFGDWSPLEGIYDPEAICKLSWGLTNVREAKNGSLEFSHGFRAVSLVGGRDAWINIDQDSTYGFCWPDFPVDEWGVDEFARAHRYSPKEIGDPPNPQPSEYLRANCPEPQGVSEEALARFGEVLRKAAQP